ncbi:MAG: hypothetical protein VCD00_19775 [Candidatus Hydrogenedentota bacterium]
MTVEIGVGRRERNRIRNRNEILEAAQMEFSINGYRRWIREASDGVPFKRVGRSRIAQCVRDLIHRIAGENKGWGYRRICGELRKLGISLGDSTVRNIMIDDGLEPPPCERAEEPSIGWKIFINAHMDSMVACDFFTKNIYSVYGVRRVFVLVFIHMGSRKVFHSFPTEHPHTIGSCSNAATLRCG